MRRLLSGLLLPLFFLAGVVMLAAAPASAAPSLVTYGSGGGTGTGTVSTSTSSNGSTVLNVSAGGFTPGETVDATVHSTPVAVGSFTANSAGVVATSITLPAGIPAGNHELILVGTVSGNTDTIPFTLSAPTGGTNPCTASYTTHASGVVLAAAYYTTACASAVPSAVGAPAASSAAPQGPSQLPFTGANAATGIAVGAIAIAGGGLIVLSSRRRRRTAWEAK